jgi:hypothetical protein
MATLKNAGDSVTDERLTHEIFGLEGDELKAELEKLKVQREASKPPAPIIPKPGEQQQPTPNPEQTAAAISVQKAGAKPPAGG